LIFLIQTQEKKIYEAPKAEVVEFETKDHIAASAQGDGAGLTDTIFD
jgi:hypothetical protein